MVNVIDGDPVSFRFYSSFVANNDLIRLYLICEFIGKVVRYFNFPLSLWQILMFDRFIIKKSSYSLFMSTIRTVE